MSVVGSVLVFLCVGAVVGMLLGLAMHGDSVSEKAQDELKAWASSEGTSFVNVWGYSIFTKIQKSKSPLQAPKEQLPCSLVLLHGYPTSSIDYLPMWSSFVEASVDLGCSSVVTLDFLGFGLSSKPSSMRDISMPQQADLVEKVLLFHNITPSNHQLYLVSHDYGVSIAMELSTRSLERRHSDRTTRQSHYHVTSLSMFNAGLFVGGYSPTFTQKVLYKFPELSIFIPRWIFERSVKRVFGNTPPTKEWVDVAWASIIHNGGRSMVGNLLKYLDDRRNNQARWSRTFDILVEKIIDEKTQRERQQHQDCDESQNQHCQNNESSAYSVPKPLCLLNGPKDPVSGKHMMEFMLSRWPDFPRENLKYFKDGVGHWPFVEDQEQAVHFVRECLNLPTSNP
eukprot:m.139213 g.139213  ORF g.139213 m.139213 type:complete len:396 (+) comp13165_c0_seq1:64-1251(+)